VVQLAAKGAFPGNTRLYTKIAKKTALSEISIR